MQHTDEAPIRARQALFLAHPFAWFLILNHLAPAKSKSRIGNDDSQDEEVDKELEQDKEGNNKDDQNQSLL